MKIDLGSYAFGSSLLEGTGTPSWGTALGQSSPDYRFSYSGYEQIIIGMMYCSDPKQHFSIPLGKGGKVYNCDDTDEIQLTSIFRKVFVNDISVDYPFLMVIHKENSNSHPGRKGIKYSDKIEYTNGSEHFENTRFNQEVVKVLKLAADSCWFVSDISIDNQDELHMEVVVIDPNGSKVYEDSQTRKREWEAAIQKHYANRGIKTQSNNLNCVLAIENVEDRPYTLDELAYKLIEYKKGIDNSAYPHVFGFYYHKYIGKEGTASADKIKDRANSILEQRGEAVIPKDYGTEMSKGKKLADYIESQRINIESLLESIPTSHNTNISKTAPLTDPLQKIVYGAPGTGKSFSIDRDTEGYDVIRTTFHPDSDYSTFVGAYKPTMGESKPIYGFNGSNTITAKNSEGDVIKEAKIEYTFVKQAFLKAYLGAWKKYVANGNIEPQFLVIEEINRGNCAQIFGDIFQLLDRGEDDFSSYPVEPDTDIQQAIKKAFAKEDEYKLEYDINIEGAVKKYKSSYGNTLSKDIQEGNIMLLPPNLYIWGTMNTSDQSLFPIDSAFKRRWDWQYEPIENHPAENYSIEVGGKKYNWWSFISAVNNKIYAATQSEDKQLGYFFVKPANKVVSADMMVNKVLFYLYNDVFKDYDDQGIFKNENCEGEKMRFKDFYGDNRTTMIERLMKNLGVDPDKAEAKAPEVPKAAAAGTEQPTD